MIATNAQSLLNRIAFALLWLFVFTVPFTQAPEFAAAGLISRVVGFSAMTVGLTAIATRKQFRLLGPIHMAMAGFILWSTVTLCWSITPDLTVQRIGTYLQLFVLVLLIWELCREEKEIVRILGAFALGTIIPALSTLRAFLPGEQTLYERAKAVGFDPDSLPFILALSLPVAYYLILREKGPLSALYRLQMGFAICAILLSGSAATMIAMVIGLSLVCWTFHTVAFRTRTNAFILFVTLALGTAMLIPASLWQHFSEESKKGGISLTNAINGGVESIRSTPAGGFGAGSMASSINLPPMLKSAFTMFAETGIMGIACFIVLLGVLFLAADRMLGVTKSFWFTVLGVWAVGVCALNWECSPPAWLLFGLLASHAACLKREGVTPAEQKKQQRTYYVEQSAEVWS